MLLISNNNSLSNCDALSICEYLANPSGVVEIHDNASGCNSQEEVEQACAITSIKEKITDNIFSIIPNPSNDKITVSSPSITGNTQLTIFNVSGEKVHGNEANGNRNPNRHQHPDTGSVFCKGAKMKGWWKWGRW